MGCDVWNDGEGGGGYIEGYNVVVVSILVYVVEEEGWESCRVVFFSGFEIGRCGKCGMIMDDVRLVYVEVVEYGVDIVGVNDRVDVFVVFVFFLYFSIVVEKFG